MAKKPSAPAKPSATKSAAPAASSITIEAPRFVVYEFEVVGVTSLIVHQFAEKAKKEIREKKLQLVKPSKRPILDPRQEFLGCFYVSRGSEKDHAKASEAWLKRTKPEDPDTWNPYEAPQGTYAMPTGAFLASVMNAAISFNDIAKTEVARHQQMIEVMSPLRWDSIEMREDAVRVGMGVADLRYRPEFHGWRTTIRLRLDEQRLPLGSWLSIAAKAGTAGVGEWRPEKKKGNPGIHGQYTIASTRQVDITKINAAPLR